MPNDEQPDLVHQAMAETDIPLDVIPLHSTNLLTVLDPSGVIQYESPAIERIFGFDQATLIGEQVASSFHPEDREAVVDAFTTVVTSEDHTVEAVEYRHETADGSYLWVESVASSDPTPAGNYVVNTRDISARKEQEAALERKSERLDRFASVIAHDLTEPLHVAQGNLELLREDYDDDRLDAIARAHDRMDALTTDLLALAREGADGITTRPVSLREVAERCWETVGTTEATLAVPAPFTIEADESHLEQLLTNLFRNALEHGAADATITVGPLDDRGGFYVEDDGDGIPPAVADRIFEHGYSSADDGTGYGLSIVEAVVEAHGWSVDVVTEPTGGTRFEISGVHIHGA